MSWRSSVTLANAENGAFYAAIAFLRDRLQRQDTVDWALGLKPSDKVNRLALLHLIEHPPTQLHEPWSTAWRLIEESWNQPPIQRHGAGAYPLRHRLEQGERTGSLVSDIVELATPRLVIAPRGDSKPKKRSPAKASQSVMEMMSISLTGNSLIKPSELAIGQLDDALFLDHLARALEGALNHFIALAERLGWIADGSWWRLGEVRRIYAVDTGDDDPDEYAAGIASTVKLLQAVVDRLKDVAPLIAARYVATWEATDTPLHLRLWATAGFDPTMVSPERVGGRLLSLDKRQFWNLHEFPEIAQLRAIRFVGLSTSDQRAIARRILRRPPREQWGRHVTDMDRVDDARTYWAVRELRRIETEGGQLPDFATAWLQEHLQSYPDLVANLSPTEGFLDGVRVYSPTASPDSQYDIVAGAERLKALEAALSTSRSAWEDDPSRSAEAWISQAGHILLVLEDFESDPANAGAYPKVWNKFGWTDAQPENAEVDQLRSHAQRVVRLFPALPDKTITEAISGLTWWLHRWDNSIVDLPEFEVAWDRVWPFAVASTNAQQGDDEAIDLNIIASSSEQEPRDLDTLNSPVGYLIGVFFEVWRKADKKRPFADGSLARRLRDTIIAAPKRSGLIARRRFVEQLPVFMNADAEWTRAELLPSLFDDSSDAVILWRGVARRRLYRDTIQLLGEQLVTRIGDKRLGRQTQRNLLFSVVVECLHAIRKDQRPAIAPARLTQMLRSLDDETRASGAEAVHQFVRDMANKGKVDAEADLRPHRLFASAAKPFLEGIWPQEWSLSTPGVSRALADLPAVSGEAFAEAVETVSRFIVPFDCWSMMDFGLYGEEDGEARLTVVDTAEKGRALLHLLDLSVGTAEGAVIPHDLGSALAHIRKVAPASAKAPSFRRLAVAARL